MATPHKTWLVLTAAVAVVLVAIAFGGQFYRADLTTHPEPAVSSGTLTLLSPRGPVTPPFDFQWASSIQQPAYRIDVFDAAGGAIAARVTREGRIAAADLLTGVKPGSYSWRITLFDNQGVFVTSSALQRFEIAAR